MGYSRLTTAYNGGTQVFPIAFSLGYLDRTDIRAYVADEVDGVGDQIYRAFTFVDDDNIKLTDPLPNPCVVIIDRTVSKDQLVLSPNGVGDFTRDTLLRGFLQLMMSLHELIDGRVDELTDFTEILGSVATAVGAMEAAEVSQLLAATSQAQAAVSAAEAAASAAFDVDLVLEYTLGLSGDPVGTTNYGFVEAYQGG